MWSVRRPENHDQEAVLSPDSTREVPEVGSQVLDRGPELAKPDVSRAAAKVMVVGPPGCCGCVSVSVSSRSRRKR
jgi:hypothetical protein